MDEIAVAYAGVAGQAELLRSGALTSVELVDILLQRIERVDGGLNAFRVVLGDSARAAAVEADAARAAGDDRPLLGVPVAVKDSVDLAGELTGHGTAGGHVAEEDGHVVAGYRRAGLVIIGKTNLPELALWPFTETQAWGTTRNPWAPDRAPGGSSGGSAAAVAAGLVAAASASDGGGSIRIPAALCGLVGLKPSYGVAPSEPPDHWYGLSHGGVLTRTVLDTALMLDATLGTTFAGALDAPAPLRIGWTTQSPSKSAVDYATRVALDTTMARMRELGHTVRPVDVTWGPALNSFGPRYLRGVHDDLAALRDPSVAENRTKHIARMGSLVPAAAVRRAVKQAATARQRLMVTFADVDVLALPVVGGPPLKVGRYAGRSAPATMHGLSKWLGFTPPFNVTGLPALAVPAGRDKDGRPRGVQLVAPVGEDARLLAVAAQLEALTGWPAEHPPVD